MPDSIREKTRAELLAVLEEFHVPLSFFDGLRRQSMEKYLAGVSPQQLKDFYLVLLMPGADISTIQAHCPAWPVGHRYAGKKPHCTLISRIRHRLVLAQRAAEEWEQRKLMLREKQIRLRQVGMALEKEKARLAAEAANPPSEPPSEPQETADEMITRIYGGNPFKE